MGYAVPTCRRTEPHPVYVPLWMAWLPNVLVCNFDLQPQHGPAPNRSTVWRKGYCYICDQTDDVSALFRRMQHFQLTAAGLTARS